MEISLSKGKRCVILLLIMVVMVLQFHPSFQQNAAQNLNDAQQPLLPKLLTDTLSLLKKSHKSSWDKIKSVLNDLQMQFSPPTLDFRAESQEDGSGVKGKMKEAVGKSFDKSKETVEESAKSAAKVVGNAAQKVNPSKSSESDAEL